MSIIYNQDKFIDTDYQETSNQSEAREEYRTLYGDDYDEQSFLDWYYNEFCK